MDPLGHSAIPGLDLGVILSAPLFTTMSVRASRVRGSRGDSLDRDKSFNSRSSKASRISLHDVISLLLGRPRPRAVAKPQALGSWRMWRRGGEDTRGDAKTRRRRGVERTRAARTACRLVRVGSCHIPETCGPRSHGGGSSRSPCETLERQGRPGRSTYPDVSESSRSTCCGLDEVMPRCNKSHISRFPRAQPSPWPALWRPHRPPWCPLGCPQRAQRLMVRR